MLYESINKEIHYLIRLPNYLRRKQEELNNLEDYISFPILRVHETGFMVSDSLPVDVEATKLLTRNNRIEKEINRAINRSRILVQAINSLDSNDQKRLIKHYTEKKDPEIINVFNELLKYITEQV